MLFHVIAHSFPTLSTFFSRQVYLAFIVMVSGLCILAKKPTSTAIAKALGVVSHDALTRLLSHSCWNASLLMNALLNQALLLATGSMLPSYLILDDVMIPKPFATWIAGAYWDWDHVEQRKRFCHRVVVVVWTNGVFVIPIAFALWHKRHSAYFLNDIASFSTSEFHAFTAQFPHLLPLLCSLVNIHTNTVTLNLAGLQDWQKELIGKEAFALLASHAANHHRYHTKNELARILIYLVVRKGICCQYITFDSWYASKENLNFLTRLGLVYYAAIPCSRNLTDAYRVSTSTAVMSQAMQVKALAALHTTRQYPPYPRGQLRALGLLVNLPGLNHGAKLVIINHRDWLQFLKRSLPPNHPIHKQKDKDPNTYLLTNNIFCPTYEIILHYRSRWSIEVMFRDLKQHLGLTACQHRSITAVKRHIALVMFAYVCLQFLRQDACIASTDHHQSVQLTIGDIKKHLQSQVLVQLTDTVASGIVAAIQRPMPKEVFEHMTEVKTSTVISHSGFLTMTIPHFKELEKNA
jgi:hypothetical protein